MNTTANSTATSLVDPLTKYPKPPYPAKPWAVPGTEAQMQFSADHGETSYQGSGKLMGRRALITNAGVVISYLNEDQDARETARYSEEAGHKAVLVPGDIGDEAHCQQLDRRTVEELGGLDILVNNAAYQVAHKSLQ
ncbi:SDR family oxidoreductase [Spirosoma taeanense]|uniref:SDR family oxidoreductase n=1 Tax=Spirosoma taeanense TaxID=2735870 RepID=UPI001F03543D|nr:SDR family oxidoreductase [Spirosoma taeanense]